MFLIHSLFSFFCGSDCPLRNFYALLDNVFLTVLPKIELTSDIDSFFSLSLFLYFERERRHELGSGRQREGERQPPAGSALSVEPSAEEIDLTTARSRPEQIPRADAKPTEPPKCPQT